MTLPDLSRVPHVALDTETTGVHWGATPVSLAWASPAGDGYAAWGHERGGNTHDVAAVRRWLRDLFARPDLIIYMHNAAFDLRMVAALGVDTSRIAARVEDTGFMAALTNELGPLSLGDLMATYLNTGKSDAELNAWCARAFGGNPTRTAQAKNYWRAPADIVGPYAVADARGTLALVPVLGAKVESEGVADIYRVETDLIPLVHMMTMHGVRVDVDAAERLFHDLDREWRAAAGEWARIAPNVNENSGQQLFDFFAARGRIPTYRRTATGAASFDADALTEYAEHDPAARVILNMRKFAKLRDVFVKGYVLDVAPHAGNRLHPEFHQLRTSHYGTVSGRFSSGGQLNAQNLPSPDRDPVFAARIRGLFLPDDPERQSWFRLDYSQIEYRFLAHYAGGSLRRAYNADPNVDFHQAVADMTGIARKKAKNLNFAVVYGQGAKATADQLGVPLDEAEAFLAQYDAGAPEIRALYKLAQRRASQRGYITTYGGRKRRFEWDPKRRRFDKGHKALNALLQGSAADLIKQRMVDLWRAGVVDWRGVALHLQVHDELDFSVPHGDEGRRIMRAIRDIMEVAPGLTVPVVAGTDVGPDWGHTAEIALERGQNDAALTLAGA